MEANYGKTCGTGSKRVSLTNYVAALSLLHSITEGRS